MKKSFNSIYDGVGIWQTVDFVLRWILLFSFLIPGFADISTAECLLIGFPSFVHGHFPDDVDPWPSRHGWRRSAIKDGQGEYDAFKFFLDLFANNGWIQPAVRRNTNPDINKGDPVRNSEIYWDVFGMSVIYMVRKKLTSDLYN